VWTREHATKFQRPDPSVAVRKQLPGLVDRVRVRLLSTERVQLAPVVPQLLKCAQLVDDLPQRVLLAHDGIRGIRVFPEVRVGRLLVNLL
jgi:hypothetical protein